MLRTKQFLLTWSLVCLAGLFIFSGKLLAAPLTIVDIDFENFTINGGNQARLSYQAFDMDLLPPGTELYSDRPNDFNINLRKQPNNINTNNTLGLGFQNAFQSGNFLVLGDNSGTIGNNPIWGTFWMDIPFMVPSGASFITIGYQYAFGGSDVIASSADAFLSSINIGNQVVMPLQNQQSITSTNGFLETGFFATTLAVANLPQSSLSLRLQLNEGRYIPTNSALGLDNIQITAIPEPSTLLLLGAGLLSLALIRRRQRT